jgi:hypothetical protein
VPSRAFEAAYTESLEQLAADPSLVERYMPDGTAADRRDVARLQGKLKQLRSDLSEVEGRVHHLLGVFAEGEVVPETMKARLCELDDQRAGLRLEIARVEQELDDLGGEAPTPQEVADLLRDFTDEIRDLPLPEKKARIRSVIGRTDYNLTRPSDGVPVAEDGAGERLFRTSGVLVITRINAKPRNRQIPGLSGLIPITKALLVRDWVVLVARSHCTAIHNILASHLVRRWAIPRNGRRLKPSHRRG